MSRPSSAFVMAANQNAAINVLFGAQSIGNIRILSFHQGSTLKSIKKLQDFFPSKFWAMPWSNTFTSTNQEHSGKIAGNLQNLFFY